jgi:hypothetical protein
LDGIIETDWLPYTFTMNWKITRPNRRVRFEKDEPICMIVPMRRTDLERFSPDVSNLTSQPLLQDSYLAWHEKRLEKVRATPQMWNPSEPVPKIQGNYIRGEGVLNERATQHQNKINVKDFFESEPAPSSADKLLVEGTSPSRPNFWSRILAKFDRPG